MTAKGFVEGRRPATPNVKISHSAIRAEDTRLRTNAAQASFEHLRDLYREHGRARKEQVPS